MSGPEVKRTQQRRVITSESDPKRKSMHLTDPGTVETLIKTQATGQAMREGR
jgi:hypothetical protein